MSGGSPPGHWTTKCPGNASPSSGNPIRRPTAIVTIDSVMRPRTDRMVAWNRLVRDLDLSMLEQITREIALSEVVQTANQLLAGEVRGRVVVNVNN